MYESIGLSDLRTALTMIEAIAWVVVLGVIIQIFTKTKFVNKQNRQIILVLFAAWGIASISLAYINTYSYVNY